MADFAGKVCFVTGGANGIGEAIVRAFREAGARVAFCDTDGKAGEKLASELGGEGVGSASELGGEGAKFISEPDVNVLFGIVDVRDANALTAFMSEVYAAWGDMDILVNNVGVSTFSPLVETSIEQFDSIIATNLRPVFITSREMATRRNISPVAAPSSSATTLAPEAKTGKMPEAIKVPKKYGRIINIASTRWLQSEPGTEGYSASKGGIVSLTHALAISLAGTGITVNSISPGWIDTGHWGKIRPIDNDEHPSGRVGVPDDIARACLFLAAPENDFIDGQNFVIDGGMTKKMIYAE